MAKIRQINSKAALSLQRAEVRRGARGKVHVGDDTGSAAARAGERAKVRRMQQAHQRQQRLAEPLAVVLVDLVTDTARLARTLLTVPLRVVSALRGHRLSPNASEA